MTSQPPAEGEERKPAYEGVLNAEKGPTFSAPEEAVADLSGEILKSLPRGKGERITCRRITGNHYRCNWWTPQPTIDFDNPAMTGLTVTTHRVSKSQMLHVTKTSGKLTITPAPDVKMGRVKST
jgi:hypothetical protein